jgi:hypothetical protein
MALPKQIYLWLLKHTFFEYPIEGEDNRIDAERINVFHAMPLRPDYAMLINRWRPYG